MFDSDSSHKRIPHPNLKMAPKVVVITGCSTGIGLETALLLANDKQNRFKVFATMRNLTKKEQLETAAGSTLNKTLFVRELDVTKEDSIKKFMERINKEEGRVDILINNAGMGQVGIIEKVSMRQIRTVYEVNVFGLIQMTQAVIPGMKAKRSGHIINIGSCAGLMASPFYEIYGSTKYAVEGFSESIAPVLKQFNISVSVIEPGPVATAFTTNINANNTGTISDNFDGPVDPDVDELTQKLLKQSYASTEKAFLPMMQTGAEIAKIVQDAILSEKPHLHYVTCKPFYELLAAKKLVDMTGDAMVDAIIESQNWDK